MQDIDFDEIDRAVSSVTNPGRDVDTPVVRAPEPSPAFSSAPAAPSPEREISSHVTPSLATRRSSGRFMDVVHPSSDMRPHAPAAVNFDRQETVPTERIGVAERPAPLPQPEPVLAPAPEPVQTETRSAFHWPDPIDLAETHAAPAPVAPLVPAPVPVVEPAPVVVPAPVIDIEDMPVTSLESTFLTNTKVEKRPLGAFSFPESDLELLDDFADTPKSPDASPLLSATEVPAVTTDEPRADDGDAATELDEDILLLEADNEEADAPYAQYAGPPTPEVTATPAPAAVEEVPVGPTSIIQQYKEHPSTDSQPSGAIYDTEAYHQPLAHPAKKSSSLWVVVWIIALIIVGGGIGAAVYFFVLPLL